MVKLRKKNHQIRGVGARLQPGRKVPEIPKFQSIPVGGTACLPFGDQQQTGFGTYKTLTAPLQGL